MRAIGLGALAALGLLVASPSLAQTAVPARIAQAAPATGALLDINSATKEELEKLPSIGPARAEAIVKGRPYKGKDELVERKIITENVYHDIKDRIIARQK